MEREGRKGISDMCDMNMGVRKPNRLSFWQREAKPGALTDKNNPIDDTPLHGKSSCHELYLAFSLR